MGFHFLLINSIRLPTLILDVRLILSLSGHESFNRVNFTHKHKVMPVFSKGRQSTGHIMFRFRGHF